jgi:hypothetical protein
MVNCVYACIQYKKEKIDWQKLLKLNVMKGSGLTPEPGVLKHKAPNT